MDELGVKDIVTFILVSEGLSSQRYNFSKMAFDHMSDDWKNLVFKPTETMSAKDNKRLLKRFMKEMRKWTIRLTYPEGYLVGLTFEDHAKDSLGESLVFKNLYEAQAWRDINMTDGKIWRNYKLIKKKVNPVSEEI